LKTKKLLIFLILLFIGCNNHTKKEQNIKDKNSTLAHKQNLTIKKQNIIINLNGLYLKFKNQKLIYPKNKTYILFDDNSNYSIIQEDVLKYLKIKYYKTNNEFLKNYFKIKIYPTIVILDKNKTIKIENFTPIEILKGF